MKHPKSVAAATTAKPDVFGEITEIEEAYRKRLESKRGELETVRQDLIAKLRQVDGYLGTDSLGTPKGAKAATGKGERLRRGELERYIRAALTKGPAPIGELLSRIREAGLAGKDASIRSKMGSAKWTRANGITKDGSAFVLKK